MVKSLNVKLWTKPICSTCILEVTMKTIKLATSDETYNLKQSKILQILSKKFSENATPVWISNEIFQEISKITRNPHPFEKIKKVITSHSKYLEKLGNTYMRGKRLMKDLKERLQPQ